MHDDDYEGVSLPVDAGSRPSLDDLVEAATAARERAYAPYSRFKVGAALRTAGGEIVTGCNVENAAYGLSVCAERTAVGAAVAGGYRKFDAVAVVTDISPPAPPCGQCLQTLVEFSGEMDVVLASVSGQRIRVRLSELLPFRFKPEMVGEGP